MRASSVNTETHSALAQSVEQMTVNHWVAGSSPAGGAKFEKPDSKESGFFGFQSPKNFPPQLPIHPRRHVNSIEFTLFDTCAEGATPKRKVAR